MGDPSTGQAGTSEAMRRLIDIGLNAPAKIPIIVASGDAAMAAEARGPPRVAAVRASKAVKGTNTPPRGKTPIRNLAT